ncbi:hypothetical protein HYC85_027477 [Camellia sinensis]|uniref:Uncharacterized protein n=1 Tax=Camellia sinensis TaxID=4442 RepID=A0A7J7GA81_CAMSI|nr:hypothetical protein HYC85_027477 [Camellia sinensis]
MSACLHGFHGSCFSSTGRPTATRLDLPQARLAGMQPSSIVQELDKWFIKVCRAARSGEIEEVPPVCRAPPRVFLIILVSVAANPSSSKSGIRKVALIGIALGTIAGAVTLSAIVSLLILRLNTRKRHTSSRRHLCEYLTICRVEDILVEGCIEGSVVHFHRARTITIDSLGTISASGMGGKNLVFK